MVIVAVGLHRLEHEYCEGKYCKHDWRQQQGLEPQMRQQQELKQQPGLEQQREQQPLFLFRYEDKKSASFVSDIIHIYQNLVILLVCLSLFFPYKVNKEKPLYPMNKTPVIPMIITGILF
ncbi:hypothetical protein ACIQW7_27700 [Peribacillus simplex]|uniref:hypothetical protein n=1 Tax=Peribacillus simplex TaxID=1478 RepID=UPI003829D159